MPSQFYWSVGFGLLLILPFFVITALMGASMAISLTQTALVRAGLAAVGGALGGAILVVVCRLTEQPIHIVLAEVLTGASLGAISGLVAGFPASLIYLHCRRNLRQLNKSPGSSGSSSDCCIQEAKNDEPKRQLLKSISVILVLIICFVVWWKVGLWLARYRLPDVNDVVSVTASLYDHDNHVEVGQFEVSQSYWSNLFAALSPCKYDSSPPEWRKLGRLNIETKNGNNYCVELYDTVSDSIGAFSVGPEPKNATDFYRGGNSMQLKETLATARSQMLRRSDVHE